MKADATLTCAQGHVIYIVKGDPPPRKHCFRCDSKDITLEEIDD